jgi:flavin-dependent dehydrogenase
MSSQFDVIVTGGGPSGSTAANLLAQGGARVLLLEKAVFPRFHIGESLLPCDVPVFDRLGVTLEGEAQHLRKGGAEFLLEAEGLRSEFPFHDSLAGTQSHAFQVERATFDLALLEAAMERGVDVHQGERVRKVEADADGVRVESDRDVYRGRYLIDATGQDALMARQHRTRRSLKDFGMAAVFRHFADLRPAAVAELEATGNILILFVDQGWMWAIPLGGGRLSVGLVTRRKGISDDWLDAAIAASPTLSRLLEGATPEAAPGRIGSYSFHNDRPAGARWVCVGDAACFLDPVFSSGVSFGMVGAAHAADVLLGAGFAEGREADPALMEGHKDWMNRGYTVFGSMIRALYEGRGLVPDIFFTPARKDNDLLRKGVTSVLAGDLWRDDNRFQESLLRNRRRRFDVSAAA